MDCKARINAQDPTYPTYKAMDCKMHCNANDTGFYGRIMDCMATITSLIVTACRSWDQGIRLVVTIDGINVSAALIDSLTIRHDKNAISDFSFYLGDTQYSPRTNSHIDLDKEVVITAYINGQEKKLITGTLDEPSAENTPDFKVSITGRDYGKKLLDKKTTIVSVQDLADSTLRNDIIKYLAEQAGITAVDIPEMDAVTIDNSFSYQTIWDMIQKEMMVELYWIKFDEDGNLKLLLDEIKSDTDLYPTPDWTYDEDRIIRLGYKKGRLEMNKITVLGKTYEKRIPTIEAVNTLLSFQKYWNESNNEGDIVGTDTVGDFKIITYCWWGDVTEFANYYVYVGWNNNDYEITDFSFNGDTINLLSQGFGSYYWGTKLRCGFMRMTNDTKTALRAGNYSLQLTGRKRDTYETRYDQISAEVTDPNSIAKYGERDGGSVEYPLLETVEQCIAVGSKAIRDSHRLLGQTELSIPFNPLIETGQTIAINDNKIGITERYYIESINHNINFGEGKVSAETVIGGVLYV
jgi:hypothetical protein